MSDTEDPGKTNGKVQGFEKGDPNIWRGGQKNKNAVRFTRELRIALVELAEEEVEIVEGRGRARRFRTDTRFNLLVHKIWEAALGGDRWAIQFISEKVEGKVPNVLEAYSASVDITKLSDDKLERLAAGEDLLSVLTG